MFPPFPQELAHEYCLRLISSIESGDIILQQLARESEERKGQGVMLGTLICKDSQNQEKILYAVSGNNKGLLIKKDSNITNNKELVVPSIVSCEEVNTALNENDLLIHQLTDKINNLPAGEERTELINQRTKLTTISLQRVFNLYSFTRFDGKKISLNEIIADHDGKLPPTGTGDCCAPKLLSYAFENGLTPVSMDEVYYGGNTKNKISGMSYPPCDERCGYILPAILGLEIIYRDEFIVVVNKQSGLLAVPGRGPEKADCIEARLKILFPQCELNQPAVHRLDMETSGIMILALTKDAHRAMNMQFENRLVHKKYVALLDGVFHGKDEGRIELKFRLDVDNRPHQIYDEINGKLGITDYKKIGVEKYKNPITGKIKNVTRVEFEPQTGRTHQLRLHASHCGGGGLGLPIVGDTLYGNPETGEKLMLHAKEITFNHPITGEQMHFQCKRNN